MPHRGCKSSYEVLTMGLIFAAAIILVTTTTEAASAQIRVRKLLGQILYQSITFYMLIEEPEM